jgi:hypothetical protein
LRRLPAAFLLALTCLRPLVAEADTMRCGSQLLHEGDRIEDIVRRCGEPAERSRTWIVRPPHFELGGREYSFPGREDVPVDVLIYDLGPQKFKRKLRFVAGKLERIETMEHGTSR